MKLAVPNRTEWIAALRSGKYPQGIGSLNRDGRYCCLGVLCEVRNYPKRLVHQAMSDTYGYRTGVDYVTGGLEASTLFGADDPTDEQYNFISLLINMNDGASHHTGGRSFAEIADYIEEHTIDG